MLNNKADFFVLNNMLITFGLLRRHIGVNQGLFRLAIDLFRNVPLMQKTSGFRPSLRAGCYKILKRI